MRFALVSFSNDPFFFSSTPIKWILETLMEDAFTILSVKTCFSACTAFTLPSESLTCCANWLLASANIWFLIRSAVTSSFMVDTFPFKAKTS